jgi:hypothetical protein
MKKIFISFVILISSFNVKQVQAQWVLIPDSNFRNAIAVLVPAAILGNNMDTTNIQIRTMTTLDINHKNINDITGVQYFDSLKNLYCYVNNITFLPSLHVPLEILNCFSNDLTSLPSLPSSLKELRCLENQLTSLPPLPPSLILLSCEVNQITSLPPLPSTLMFLEVYQNQLTSLPVLPSSLYTLACWNNQLTSIPTLPPLLHDLNCDYNQLSILPSLPSYLSKLECTNNQLTSLPSLPSNLYELRCSGNLLTSLPPLPTTQLTMLICGSNQITCLPTLPGSLQTLNGTNAGYSCLPNIPASLTSITGPATICNQNQAAITSGGATTFCAGGSVTLNANISAGLTYQWKKNGASISGATSSSYIATTTGSYTVVESGSSGCTGDPSAAVVITANALPNATITPAGATTFCSAGNVSLSAVVTSNTIYQWKKGANLISGATLSSYTATTGGNYRVIVTNTVTGCSKTTAGATIVSVNPRPAATITPQGPTTFCAGGSVVLSANGGGGLSYQWKKGVNNISGATFQNYTAITGGTYKVIVTNANSCSKTSAGQIVTVNCRLSEENDEEAEMTIFPNPSDGMVTLKFNSTENQNCELMIIDITGREVIHQQIKTSSGINENTVDISNLVKGIYLVKLRTSNKEIINRIVKE